MTCDRCGKETKAYIMSIFNTEEICMACKKKEEAHPRYEEARKAESDAMIRGDSNFPGIGWIPEGDE